LTANKHRVDGTFSFDLEWDCIAIANKIKQSFQERKLTDKKNKPLDDSTIFGMSEDGKSQAFIVEGFDTKRKFGVRVILPTNKKEIDIIGGRYNDTATLKAKYNETFTDITKASKCFDDLLKDYDAIRNDSEKSKI